MAASSSKKPTPYKKLPPAAKKSAVAKSGGPGKGRPGNTRSGVAGKSGARSGRRGMG